MLRPVKHNPSLTYQVKRYEPCLNIRTNLPQISGPFWPENSDLSGLDLQGNMALKSRPIWPDNWAIWHENLGKSNLAWKYGLEIQAHLAWSYRTIWPGKSGQIWPGYMGQFSPEIKDNMVWKSRPIGPRNMGQCGREI